MKYSIFMFLSGIVIAVAACTGAAPTALIRKPTTEAQVGSASSGMNQKSKVEATEDDGSASEQNEDENNGGNSGGKK